VAAAARLQQTGPKKPKGRRLIRPRSLPHPPPEACSFVSTTQQMGQQ